MPQQAPTQARYRPDCRVVFNANYFLMVIFRTQCEILLHVSRAHSSVQSDEAHAVKTKEKQTHSCFFQNTVCALLFASLRPFLSTIRLDEHDPSTASHMFEQITSTSVSSGLWLFKPRVTSDSASIRPWRRAKRFLFAGFIFTPINRPDCSSDLRGWQSLSVVLGNVLHFTNLILRTGDIERRERTQVSGECWV